MKYTIDEPKGIDLVIKILKTGLEKRYWRTRDVLSIVDSIKKNDMMDIMVDAPYYEKHIEKISKAVNI